MASNHMTFVRSLLPKPTCAKRHGLALIGASALGIASAGAQGISFVEDVKPIIDKKCVSCHACWDAPGQLDLRSVSGIIRGAKKIDPYGARAEAIPPTSIWNSANSLEDWRAEGFFSVIEGGKDSIMAKMLRHGYDNPVEPNELIDPSVEIDPFKRKYTFPNDAEIDAYISQRPREGMPLAVSGLTSREYADLIQWLDQGAPFDVEPAIPSDIDLALIREWESFLNAPDLRTQLMARYIFEHIALVNFHFENSADANLFIMVRSATPPGEDVVPVKQHVHNGPVEEGQFYYRFMLLDQTGCVKSKHLRMHADQVKLDRWKEIFDEEEWTATGLPGYTERERYDPINIFKEIPVKVRYKFLLDNTWNLRGAIVHGPSCRGNQAIGSVQDQGWHFYENPETSLYVNDPEYRAIVDPLLSFFIDNTRIHDALVTRHEYIERRKEFMKLRMQREQEIGVKSQMTDIWRGEDADDTPVVTVYRHQTDAYQLDKGVVAGDYPKNAWFMDFPIFEQAYYTAVTNYDLYDASETWTWVREIFGLARIESEMNLLRMIPAEDRMETFQSWYQGPLTADRMKLAMPIFDPEDTIPTGIEYSTDNTMREFFVKLVDYMGDRVQSEDLINRSDAERPTDPVQAALRTVVEAAREDGVAWRRFKEAMPEASLLRIDREDGSSVVYTMTKDRWFNTKAFISASLQEDDPSKARVSFLEGVKTSYPRMVFTIPEAEIDNFTDALIRASNREAMSGVVERWGVRRSSPDFWDVLDSLTNHMREEDPLGAGTLDVSTYLNL